MAEDSLGFRRWEPAPLNETGSQRGVNLPTAEALENIHQQAHQEGYDTGYEEGKALPVSW